MRTTHEHRLLPAPLDALAARLAPSWGTPGLDAGSRTGSGARLLVPCLWLLGAAALVQSVLHIIDAALLHLSVERFNADADFSLDGWMGTLTTGLAAWSALLLALLAPRQRRPLLLLAALCAYLSMDDMLQLHEAVAHLAQYHPVYGHSGYDLWTAVYLPLLSITGYLLLRTARSIDPRAGRWITAGLTCLVIAVLLEALVPALLALGGGKSGPVYQTEVVIEEALELVGWGLLAVALAAAVADLLLARPDDQQTTEPAYGSAAPAGRHSAG